DTLGDEVKVTVIAAGFDSGQLPYKKVEVHRAEAPAQAPDQRHSAPPQQFAPAPEPVNSNGWPLPATAPTRTPVGLDEDLDVPDFLK
ncbi:MAG: cell division protein FtsZ, partial [Jatrophihabitans sp.]